MKNSTSKILTWIFLALANLCAFEKGGAAIPDRERQVLVEFFADTGGNEWRDHSGWGSQTIDPCDWHGIACDGNHAHVTQINLFNNNLRGALPQDLIDLPALEIFAVSFNGLSGRIPSLRGLARLRVFSVEGNQIQGEIPSLAGLESLQLFLVDNNRLTGPIPSLEGLASLEDFDIEVNQLSGSIPALAGLTSLVAFSAGENRLEGAIPPLSGLASLKALFIRSNRLTGALPSLSELPSLLNLQVGDNLLSGHLPPAPRTLIAGESNLCPNMFATDDNVTWDLDTGLSPWWQGCVEGIFASGFD